MKANKPVVIAIVLWLLFVVSNAFAVFKPPYPLKSLSPDQIIIIGGGSDGIANSRGEGGLGTANKPK